MISINDLHINVIRYFEELADLGRRDIGLRTDFDTFCDTCDYEISTRATSIQVLECEAVSIDVYDLSEYPTEKYVTTVSINKRLLIPDY